MDDRTHWQMRLEAALFGTSSAHSERELEAVALQAEALRDAHDLLSKRLHDLQRDALPRLFA